MRTYLIILTSILLSFCADAQLKIITNGNVGIGENAPSEKLVVDGAILLGNTTNSTAGTIRWNGTCFEGHDGIAWQSITDCSGGCQSGCECFPNIDGVRDMPNTGWNNQFNQGGTGISGDGELCFEIGTITKYSLQTIGLNSDPNSSANKNSIDFGLTFQIFEYLGNPIFRLYVDESGVNKGLFYSMNGVSYSNSVFCVRRTGTTIEYLMDGSIIYTSTVSSTGQLYFDNSFYDSSGHPSYGQRPCEFNVNNIKICPNGTYSSSSVSPPTSSGLDESHAEHSTDLRNEIDVLKSKVAELLLLKGNHSFSSEEYERNVIDLELSNYEEIDLSQNRPNPFGNNTEIEITLPSNYNSARLEVYDSYGVNIKTIDLQGSKNITTINIDSENLISGIYNYALFVDDVLIDSKKMVKAN